MQADQFVQLLRNVVPRGNGWMARCPAHDDAQNSLSVSKGRDDAILVKCHAGCDTAAVVAALGIKLSDLFGAPKSGRGRGRAASAPTIVATYDYRRADGDLLYQAVREAPKHFFQRRPHPTKPDTWLNGMLAGWYVPGRRGWVRDHGGGDRDAKPPHPDAVYVDACEYVIYRLDELAALRPRAVHVVEGEKDADRLWSGGLAATTNVAGAGKWRDEYAAQLVEHGAGEVVLIPDNDVAGWRHMAAVMASCRRAGLETRWVTLPGLAPKEDVSDYLDGHGTCPCHPPTEPATVVGEESPP